MKKKMKDKTCLAEGCIYSVDTKETGLNANEVIVGPTNCGKTTSISEPRLLHTHESSVIVPLAKVALARKYAEVFRERGYEVDVLDFSNPEKSEIGYDPMDYVKNEDDALHFARCIVGIEKGARKMDDPYWDESASSVLAAEIKIVLLSSRANEKRASFADVVKLHKSMKIEGKDGIGFKTSIDTIVDEMDEKFPESNIKQAWNIVKVNSDRTTACILSVLNSAFENVFSRGVLQIVSKDNRVQFDKMGKKKKALFIITPPMNTSFNNFVNIMYGDLFKNLFETAEKNPNGALEVPVHIICDDFACSSRIRDFDRYISVFRAARISVTLLLQSESQLQSMYGEGPATTIINNCDTYVFMGGSDFKTCQTISYRLNKPIDKVMQMPLEQVVVFRRGSAPVIAKRYQTYDDPLYKEVEVVGR